MDLLIIISRLDIAHYLAPLAQLVARLTCNQMVKGSSPLGSLCRCGITAIISAFQADDVGSTPITCSKDSYSKTFY